MHFFLSDVLQAFMLSLAISIDVFMASFAYGSNKVKIPFKSKLILSAVCSAMLAMAFVGGNVLKQFLSIRATMIICFMILIVIGAMKLLESIISIIMKKRKFLMKDFAIWDFKLTCKLEHDKVKIDNQIKELTVKEAAYLSVALSVDGMAVGVGAGMQNVNMLLAVTFSLVMQMFCIIAGSYLGRKLSDKLNFDLSWLSGVVLGMLAISKLL